MRTDYKVQHEFDQRFPLWHCVLYYLGWYEKSENRWIDLKKCLVMDGYCGESFSNYDVYKLILNIADNFNLYCANMGWNLISIGTIIGDDWWIRNYEEQGLENPDWMYSIEKLFAKFALYYTREQVKLPCPDFKKGDPIRYSGFKNGKTYKEANKYAKTYNWYGTAPNYDWRRYWNPEYKHEWK